MSVKGSGKGKAKEKVIGFKVSEESNLLQRLKMVVRRTGKSYGELLEKWIGNEESNLGPLLFDQPDGMATYDPQASNNDARMDAMEKTIADLTAQLEASKGVPAQPNEEVASLKLQVSELIAKVEALKPNSVDDMATVEHEPEVEEGEPVADPYEETKLYILELWKSGKNKKEIAELLNAEGRSTKSGLGKWYPASVGLVLRDHEFEQAEKKEEMEAEQEAELPDVEQAVIETMMEKGKEIEEIENELDITFTPDPPRRRGRPKKVKAETPSEGNNPSVPDK